MSTLAIVSLLSIHATPATAQSEPPIQFTDGTDTSLRGRNSESWGQSVGDLNNDGWADIFVNNHRDRHSFYINNGDRTFTDHTLTVDRDSIIAGTYRAIDYHSGAQDFYGFTRNLTIPAGQMSTSTVVSIIDDTAAEANEQFSVRIIEPVNAVIGNSESNIAVIDDD